MEESTTAHLSTSIDTGYAFGSSMGGADADVDEIIIFGCGGEMGIDCWNGMTIGRPYESFIAPGSWRSEEYVGGLIKRAHFQTTIAAIDMNRHAPQTITAIAQPGSDDADEEEEEVDVGPAFWKVGCNVGPWISW